MVEMELALQGLNIALKLIAELKAQQGMTDEQLQALALKNGDALRGNIAQYIASL